MRMSSIRYAITRWPASIVGCWLWNGLWNTFCWSNQRFCIPEESVVFRQINLRVVTS